jgi:arylsulfatase A-like enzyme
MALSGPGISAGKRNDLVNNLDIFPALLQIAGMKTGQSETLLAPNARKNIFVESYGMCTPGSPDRNSPDAWCFSLRSQGYRYSWYPYGNDEQFFDLSEDPDETRDISRSLEHKSTIEQLKAELREQLYWLRV